METLYGNDNRLARQWNIQEKDAEEENIGQPIFKEEFETALKAI